MFLFCFFFFASVTKSTHGHCCNRLYGILEQCFDARDIPINLNRCVGNLPKILFKMLQFKGNSC